MSKRWGEPTWYFFHTFIEKISPSFYNNNHKECIEIYEKICNNLPCPICSEHALKTLKSADYKLIKTKADMIEFLRQFHNIVNIRVNSPIKSKEFVIKNYKLLNLNIIIKNFYAIYSHNYGNLNLNSLDRANKRRNYLRQINNVLNILLKQCY